MRDQKLKKPCNSLYTGGGALHLHDLSAPDARADALHSGAEVVGGDGEATELVRCDPLLEVAEVDRAPHANQRRLPAQRFQVRPRVVVGKGGDLL